MKQSKMTKRLLAVMMSFLMAFSSVQGYIKAEDTEEITNQETSNQIIDEVDSEFTVDTENEIVDEVDKKDDADLDTETSDEATNSDIVEDTTDSDTTENATDSDVNQATGGDAVEEATPSDADQVIIPETDFEWEDIEGAQINGTMGMRFFYRNAALSLAEAGNDVSGEIEVVSSNATIDGKKIVDEATFDINTSSTFAFDFEWCADQAKTFNAGDFMTIKIGTIKGLNYESKTSPVTLYISGVKVGSYYLTYTSSSGELVFHIDFSDNIGYFNNIGGYFRGSSKFNKLEEGTSESIKFMDSATGTVTVKPIKPVEPGNGTGKGWSATVPSDFNYDEKPSLKKDIKWIDTSGNNKIEYRVGFFDLIKEYEKAEPFEGNIYHDVILMDELDGNQSYQLYAGGAPFFIEVPIFYYGTNNSVGYQGTGNEEVVFKSGIQSKDQPGISASIINITSENFTEISEGDIEEQVRNTSRSWGIIKNGTSEKLIINVGKLGSTNPNEAITMADINQGWKLQGISKALSNKVKEAEEHIEKYKDDSYSPKQNLLKCLDDFKSIVPESHNEQVNVFEAAILAYINGEINDAPELNKDVVEIVKDKKYYDSLMKSLSNYKDDMKVYNDNKDLYIAKWQNRIENYKKTIEYYIPSVEGDLNKVNAPIHGFIIKYKTKVTNLSQETVTNNVTVNTGLTSYQSTITAKHNFKAGIKGNYTNGDVVLVKADSRYGYKEEDLATSTVKGMEGVKFQVFKEGNTTPIKFMDSIQNADEHYVYFAGNHDNDPKFTDVLVTDSKGTIALSSLPTNGNYYFKEVGTVDGYYGNQNQKIEFQVDKNQITYKLAENVSRSVTLKKVDAETKSGLEGVTFAIYDKKTNTELTGFTKDGDVYLYDKKGNAELKTNKEGILEVRNLPAGEFYMKETKALEDYMPLEGKANYFPFTLSEDLPEDGGAIIKINNGENILNFKLELPEFKASLKVIKKGDDDKLLDGVEFELYTASDDELVGTYVTDVNGEITINDLTIGTYYLIETKGKDGYEFDSTKKYEVVINGENNSIEKEIINNKKVIPPTPIVPDVNPDRPVDPDRPVNPDKPEVNIPDEDVPLGPGEEVVEIEEEDVPLSDGGDNAFVEIEEEDVPLGSGVPNTGDGLYFWIPTMLISMAALGFLNVLRRKLSK